MKVVLDASVIIAWLNSEDAHHSRASDLLSKLAGESWRISPVTLAEVLVAPARAGRSDEAQAHLAAEGIDQIPWDPTTPGMLAQVRARTSLKLPDCSVIVAALATRPAVIATFDEQLAKAAESEGVAVYQ